MGARLGARRKERIWMMKPTFYLLYIVRGTRDSLWEENMKEKQRGNFKEKKKTTTKTTTTTRAQQLLSIRGTQRECSSKPLNVALLKVF